MLYVFYWATTKSKREVKRLIVITGGGTGGHTIPAMSLAELFLKKGFKVLYIGSKNGIEKKIFNLDVEKVYLNLSGIKGKNFLNAIKGILLATIALVRVLAMFLKIRPVAVIGTGGFVCIPAIISGYLVGSKIYLQEQNAVPGASVRYLSKLAEKIYVGFEDCKKFFPEEKVVVSGNPIKEIFFSQNISYHKLEKHEKMNLLVMGGSQGSKFINELLFSAIRYLDKGKVRIFHQTGEKYNDMAKKEYEKNGVESEVFPFTDNMIYYYNIAHLVIGRSGAMSVSELIAVKRPAILIPFPHAIYDHQAKNAEFLKKLGTALVFREEEIDGEKLAEIINDFCNNPEKLFNMAIQYDSIKKKNSTEFIVNQIVEEISV